MQERRYHLYALLALFLALAWPLLKVLQDVPISGDDPRSGKDSVYNLIDLKAPPGVAGPLIQVMSYAVTRSFLSPFILRHLLNVNGVQYIRELAASEECASMAPTYFPVHRHMNITSEMRQMANLHQQFLHNGIRMKIPLEERPRDNGPKPYHGIMDYHKLYSSGKATPSQVMEELITGAKKLSHLNIFSSFLPDDIRQQALASDQRWRENKPLSVFDGVPVAIKDQIPVRNHRMCQGSDIQACVVHVREDDLLARRLRDAGAIHVGVTVMTEGGVTPLGYSAHFDGPFNPYNVDHYPGGSSAGSTVAVASGLVPMAVGFDGGGSIRVPAAMSGTMGLAPTFGRIPHDHSIASTMTKAGPIAATLEDVALAHLLLGQTSAGSFQTNVIGVAYVPPPHLGTVVNDNGELDVPRVAGPTSLQGTRLGIFWEHFQHCDSEVYEASLRSVRYLESLGAEVVNITIPHLREIHLSHGIQILSEFGMLWDRQFHDPNHHLEANTEITIALGRTVKASEIIAAAKVRSYALQKVCKEIFRGMELDAIVSPMLGDKVPRALEGYRNYGESNNAKVYRVMRYVPLANLLGLPGLSVPVGYEKENSVPIGFQLLGDAWCEHKLLRIGMYLEQSAFLQRRRPPAENFHDTLEKFV